MLRSKDEICGIIQVLRNELFDARNCNMINVARYVSNRLFTTIGNNRKFNSILYDEILGII